MNSEQPRPSDPFETRQEVLAASKANEQRSRGRSPLQGVMVLDLGQIYNGPYCGFLLAMAGATVIKIEPPQGENLRRRSHVGGAALPFAMLNSNKRLTSLNLKSERGRALLLDMVSRADVLLENFAPGVMDRLGLGYEVLRSHNPRLVYGQSSGYGCTGPHRDYPAMDLTVQAMTGVMSITGFPDRPPVKAGPALCDFFGGVHLYAAIVTALFDRERTGAGRLVEVSMQEAVYPSLSSSLGLYHGSGGKAPPRTASKHGGMAEAPYNVYPAADGYIAIICAGEKHWQALLAAMERQDAGQDPRFATLEARVENMDEVDRFVADFTRRFDKNVLFERLVSFRVPCAPVRDLVEVVNDTHMHSRRALERVDHPQLGPVVLPNSALRFDGMEPLEIVPSGDVGRDNDLIFGGWLGLPEDVLATLAATGVI